MTPDEASDFVNQLLIEKYQKGLSDCERAIAIGIWQHKSYEQIYDEAYVASVGHLRNTASGLFKKIKGATGITVYARNFRATIEYLSALEEGKRQEVGLVSTLTEASESIELVPNPFIPRNGAIDNPQHFFNRELHLKEIFEDLRSGSSVAVVGERQIGKSSLLLAVARQSMQLLQREPIYLNLQRIKDEEDFYDCFCQEVGIDNCMPSRFDRAIGQRKLLLLIDEAEKMSEMGFTQYLRGRLRSLAEGSNPPLRLVFASRDSLTALFANDVTSPLDGICSEIRLKGWDEETARAFMRSRLESTSIRFQEKDIMIAITESGGHPQKLMQLCYALYKVKKDESSQNDGDN